MIKKAPLLLFIFLVNILNLNAQVYNVKDFGAKGDSVTLETVAIQSAIDKAWTEGGGTVLIPAGIYRIGGLILKDNVNLNIVAGATLLGSADIKDYREIIHKFESRTNGLYAKYFMIFAEDAKNISITGKGIIHGNGKDNYQVSRPQNARPFMIRLVNCQYVTIRDINLLEPANWTCHLLGCNNVVIEGVRMENITPGNGDGLDIDASRNVRVSNSFFDTVDDAIVMKATCDSICSDVVITNCNITSKHGSALKTGTESNGGFKNISISNCTIKDTPKYAGIEFMTVDGGVMENITVTNITMENVGSPIFVQLGNRSRPFKSGQYVDHTSTVKDISFSHIYVDNASMPIMVSGLKAKKISNIFFDDISVNYYETIKEDPLKVNEVPLEETAYPMVTMYGKNFPAYGFYGRNMENVVIKNLRVNSESAMESRPAMIFDNASETDIYDVKASISSSTSAMIYLRSSQNVIINHCRSLGENSNLIVAEKNCGDLSLQNNILKSDQTELKTIEALQDIYLFDDLVAETKYSVPKGEVVKGILSHKLSEGSVKHSFEVKKGQVYQLSLLTLTTGSLPEKIVIEYSGERQEFIVDWDQWGWAPITLIKEFSKDQKISVEVLSGKAETSLELSKIYLCALNYGYTD